MVFSKEDVLSIPYSPGSVRATITDTHTYDSGVGSLRRVIADVSLQKNYDETGSYFTKVLTIVPERTFQNFSDKYPEPAREEGPLGGDDVFIMTKIDYKALLCR